MSLISKSSDTGKRVSKELLIFIQSSSKKEIDFEIQKALNNNEVNLIYNDVKEFPNPEQEVIIKNENSNDTSR